MPITTRSIDQRSAAVARIDRRVGLDQRDVADLAYRADDAARHRVREHAERRANGDDFLSDTSVVTRSHREHRLIGVSVVHLKQREIAAGRDG